MTDISADNTYIYIYIYDPSVDITFTAHPSVDITHMTHNSGDNTLMTHPSADNTFIWTHVWEPGSIIQTNLAHIYGLATQYGCCKTGWL